MKVAGKGYRQEGTQTRKSRNQKTQTEDNHIIPVGQGKHPQQATQERQSYKQWKTTQTGSQGQGHFNAQHGEIKMKEGKGGSSQIK